MARQPSSRSPSLPQSPPTAVGGYPSGVSPRAIPRAIPRALPRALPRAIPRAISQALLRWWAQARRDLPWRRRSDPYAIWVSEVMLQQTRVRAVLDYYQRFLAQFPTVAALAAAPQEDVLRAWQGLGYYSRARNLHAAAKLLVAQHDGQLPPTAEGLGRLPGIGVYTAAAIASIAFSQGAAVVDGNVARVLCRLLAIEGDPRQAAVLRRLQAAADALLPVGKAGDFNQAMMDLGAMICTPRRPRCDACPIRRRCSAAAAGTQALLPQKAPRRTVPHYDVAVAVIRSRGRLLIDRRPENAMLGGMWELPGGKPHEEEPLAHAAVREVREELGIEVEIVSPPVNTRGARTALKQDQVDHLPVNTRGARTALEQDQVDHSPVNTRGARNAFRHEQSVTVVQHAYSHFRVTLHAFECRHVRGRARPLACAAVRWVPFAELGDYPFPAATLRVLETIDLIARKTL